MFTYCWVLRALCLFCVQSFVRYVLSKYFLQICGLSFHYLKSIFCRAKVFYTNEAQLTNFFLHGFCFQSCIKKVITIPEVSSRLSPTLSSQNFKIWGFTFTFYMIHFELIFMKCVMSFSLSIYIFFCMWMSFIKKNVFFPLNCLCSFIKDQVTMFVWVWF